MPLSQFLERARQLWRDGDPHAARAWLETGGPAERASAWYWTLRDTVLDDLLLHEEAISSHFRAVALAPENQLVSRALFHSLWDSARRGNDEHETVAIEELGRFFRLGGSTWHERIVADLHRRRGELWPGAEE